MRTWAAGPLALSFAIGGLSPGRAQTTTSDYEVSPNKAEEGDKVAPADKPDDAFVTAEAAIVTAEAAMKRYRQTMQTTGPGCADTAGGGDILVCANTDFAATQRLPFPALAGVGQSRFDGVAEERPTGSLLSGIGFVARAAGLVDPPLRTGDYEKEDRQRRNDPWK